jgi:hypothetical protein
MQSTRTTRCARSLVIISLCFSCHVSLLLLFAVYFIARTTLKLTSKHKQRHQRERKNARKISHLFFLFDFIHNLYIYRILLFFCALMLPLLSYAIVSCSLHVDEQSRAWRSREKERNKPRCESGFLRKLSVVGDFRFTAQHAHICMQSLLLW